MDVIFHIIGSILGFGLDLIFLFLKLILACVAGGIAYSKHRSAFWFGLITFFFPWFIFILPFIPKKYPRFSGKIANLEAFRGKNPVAASIMALAAMVAKADGKIEKDEIFIIRKFIATRFGMEASELNNYAGAFEYGKNHPEDYLEFTSALTAFYGYRKDMMIAIAYLLTSVAAKDKTISEKEDAQIRKIVVQLGISEYEYTSIKMACTNGDSTYGGNQGAYGYSGYYQSNSGGYGYADNAQTQASLVKKYSDILGVAVDASLADIKKAYRKLMKEYHPDKMAAEGMPKEYEEFATKKSAEINEAYEYLKKVKEGQ